MEDVDVPNFGPCLVLAASQDGVGPVQSEGAVAVDGLRNPRPGHEPLRGRPKRLRRGEERVAVAAASMCVKIDIIFRKYFLFFNLLIGPT